VNRQQLKNAIMPYLNSGMSQAALAQHLGVKQSEISRCCLYFGITWPRQYRDQAGEKNSSYVDGLSRSSIERLTRIVLTQIGRNLHICERCGLHDPTKELPRHHKDRDRSNNTEANLEVLCTGCHSKEHMSEQIRDDLGRFT